MNETDCAIQLVPFQGATMTVSRVRVLAERGRSDMLCLEEAHGWLKRGMALHTAAFEDSGWKAIVDTQNQLRNKHDAQFRVIVEFLRLVTEGADPETTSAYLNLNDEQRETANTLRSFWPDTSVSLVRAAKKQREEEETARHRHEDRLHRAFLCFQTGYSLDPYNREINFILAEYYSVGLGVDRNEETAMIYLRRSASLGHTGAQRQLSYRYSAAMRNSQEPDWLPWSAERNSAPSTHHRPTCSGND